MRLLRFTTILYAAQLAIAQGPENVLVVVNNESAISRSIGESYARKRSIPQNNFCRIQVKPDEEISRADYEKLIEKPISSCLAGKGLREKIIYIVTTMGVPLRVAGSSGLQGETAAVDSELTLLYLDMVGRRHSLPGIIQNPMFGRWERPFTRAEFPIYLVTRLAGYDFNDVRGLIDRSLAAKNRGKVVLDLRDSGEPEGDDWLRDAARHIPPNRLVLEETTRVVYDETDVIGFASWGSNDSNRKRRQLNFKWLPGAVMTEFVSTNARTFARPPDTWTIGTWKDSKTFFADSPQTMIGDYIHEGVTGTSGHVAEPYLALTPRPDFLFRAYLQGRTLAESYYLSIPALSWENVVIGDPLCTLKP